MATSVLVYSMEEVIGDGLIKLPFVAAVRAAFPDARITWVAAKGQTVYETSLKSAVEGLIDEVITHGVTGASLADLLLRRRPFGGRKFDVVIDTQTNVRRSLVAKRAAGLFISPAADFRFSGRKPAAWPEAMMDRLMTLLSLAAGREIGFAPARLAQADKAAAAERLLPTGPVYVGFAPGAGGEGKRWPLDRYIALAQIQAAAGRVPVFFLTPAEAEAIAAVRAALPTAMLPEIDNDVQAVKGPLLVVALGGRLAAAVANDAGPGHMLAAGGAPLLSLQLTRRKATKFPPAAVRLEMLIAEDYGEGGMAAIPVADASAALERLLQKRRAVSVSIPVSAGELIDKITILRVKASRIDAARQANVAKELSLLEAVAERELSGFPDLADLTAELEAINARLWDIEEGKRDCERRSDFGPAFVELARAVYIENDRRAGLKRRINEAAGSELIEEKSYRPY